MPAPSQQGAGTGVRNSNVLIGLSANVCVGLLHKVVGRSLHVSAGGHNLSQHGPPVTALLGPAAGQVVVAAQVVAHQGKGRAGLGVSVAGIDVTPVSVDREESSGLHRLDAGGLVVADKLHKLHGWRRMQDK